MAVTDFKYATISDLQGYFVKANDFDGKFQLFDWESAGIANLWRSVDCGLVEVLFVNSIDLGAPESAGGDATSNGKWFYDSDENYVIYYNSNFTASTIHNNVFEAGKDFTTYMNQQLVNASMELNNLLDARYPTPLPKNTQIQESVSFNQTAEYDAIIKKATCYICASNLIRAKDPTSEEADYYYDLVSNSEGTGITDRLNKGEWKLSFEVDDKDSQGSILKIVKTGYMDLVETAGQYYGEPYDLLKITCTTAGIYGTAKCKVEYYGNDKLLGSETTDNIVTGGIDYWSGLGGLGVRFQGTAMAEDDAWEIPVVSEARKISNASTGTINLSRKGKIF